ncbi:DUF397 domain-containing protein [Streptomyces sp. NPDC093111]|uniref:DUF397 domain-containing protein n=1 Tax=Streptomyces sp. NPDC093111 TaxID=3154978 RepID=UPI0034403A9E
MSQPNLYESEITGEFAALCGGAGGTSNAESCLTLAELTGGGYALGDSKPEGAGRQLRMSEAEITTFATEWLAGNRGPSA